ncbi:MAG TPA: hypothetical protein VGN37_23850 [Actinocatenispora sp.]
MKTAVSSDNDASSATWERPVRRVTLAARGDVLTDMSKLWHTYVAGVDEHKKSVLAIWVEHLSDWNGEAADACQAALKKIGANMLAVHNNYGEMPTLLGSCAQSVRDAIGAIPIPLFGGGGPSLPAGGADTSGGGLYDDYDKDRSAYSDYAFQRKAYDEIVAGARIRGSSGKYERSGVDGQAANSPADRDTVTRDYRADPNGKYFAEVARWYTAYQKAATNAEDKLLNDYSAAHSSVPGRTKLEWEVQPTPAARPAPSGTGTPGGAGVDTAGPSTGALPPPVGGTVPTSAGALPHALPPHEVLGPPETNRPTVPSGTDLAGTSDPVETRLDQRTGPGGVRNGGGAAGAGLPDPASWGNGATSVPVTTTGNRWWNTPSTGGPTGPRVPSPGLSPGAVLRREPGGASGVGMIPHNGSGAGKKDPEERQTWLREDDEDIWGPRWEDQFTGLVE